MLGLCVAGGRAGESELLGDEAVVGSSEAAATSLPLTAATSNASICLRSAASGASACIAPGSSCVAAALNFDMLSLFSWWRLRRLGITTQMTNSTIRNTPATTPIAMPKVGLADLSLLLSPVPPSDVGGAGTSGSVGTAAVGAALGANDGGALGAGVRQTAAKSGQQPAVVPPQLASQKHLPPSARSRATDDIQLDSLPTRAS